MVHTSSNLTISLFTCACFICYIIFNVRVNSKSNLYAGVTARGSDAAECSDPHLHGRGPLQLHAAPRQIPQTLQQKGKLHMNILKVV